MTVKPWQAKSQLDKQLQPALLGQPNIPKPLHGINPRTIMGASKWQDLRRDIIGATPYCRACGKETLILDLHEDYNIDYTKATLQLRQYVPLCKSCHSFIHSGLLTVRFSKKQIDRYELVEILLKGLAITKKHNIPVFTVTYTLAKSLGLELNGIKQWSPPVTSHRWEDWRLIYEGKTYRGKSEKQWKQQYKV